jgi:hypothetical protein
MSTFGATALATAAGLAFGLLLPSVARADDPPPPTVPSPTMPTPDPAPTKPRPKPAPSPRQVSRTQTYHPPAAPAASTRPAAAVTPNVGAQTKPKPKKVQHEKVPVKKKTTLPPKVTAALPVGAVDVSNSLQTTSGSSLDLGSLLIVLGLGFAIACFTIALVPATYVRWRAAAIFVSERQVDVTIIGLALLVTVAFTLFWTRAP